MAGAEPCSHLKQTEWLPDQQVLIVTGLED